MKLTAKERDALKPDDYAVPGKKKLPIHDRKHVMAAWTLLHRTSGLSDAEVTEAERRILARAKALGIDTSKWSKGKKPAMESFALPLSERQAALHHLMVN